MNYRLTKFNASVEDRNNLIGDEVTVRILVASQFGSEEELFRSQVVAIEGRQAKLFFADFGDCSAQPVPTLATPGCALLPCRTISQGTSLQMSRPRVEFSAVRKLNIQQWGP